MVPGEVAAEAEGVVPLFLASSQVAEVVEAPKVPWREGLEVEGTFYLVEEVAFLHQASMEVAVEGQLRELLKVEEEEHLFL